MSRPSHTYSGEPGRLVAAIAGPLGWVALFAAAMHLLAVLAVLPRPRPAWDMDQTILAHQVEAAVSAAPADILLLGDSSCMMNVDAVTLGTLLPGNPSVRSLATLSYLSFDGHAHMLREYLRHHPASPGTVVLLMHPESLRRLRSEPYFMELLQAYAERRESSLPGGYYHRAIRALGLQILRDHLLSRVMPRPLPPSFARAYGFQLDLERALDKGHGTLTQPGLYRPGPNDGNAEYQMVDRARPLAESLRAALPEDCRLVVGITPIPSSFAPPAHARRCRDLLATLDSWLQPHELLTGLPLTLPDDECATLTHLNQQGRAHYTTLLADALK